VALLEPARGGVFVDCTVGLGGHARALLEAAPSRLIGLDRDPDATCGWRARRLRPWADRVELVHADYRSSTRCSTTGHSTVSTGILADLGVSSMQLDAEGRGFSFRRDEPLDMRMDNRRAPRRRTCWRTWMKRSSPT
jgi:16S rRNA (cytosine1402-N4)-methyltransferase